MSQLVSVVITTYMRSPKVVFRAIESVLNQTYPDIEIIIVDDSPADYPQRTILEKEISKYNVKYIQHPTNMGACVARNTGLRVANGKYIAFLDDDDEWLPDKIERQLSKFTDDQIALVYCARVVIDDSSNTVSNEELVEASGYIFDSLIFNNFIGSTSFPLIRKSALDEIGGFDPKIQSAQDYDVWLRLSQKYKVDYVSVPLVKYHIHGGERISTNHKARISGQERLIQKNIEYLTRNHKAYWWRLLRLSLQYAYNLELSNALLRWGKGCLKQPFRLGTNINYLGHIFYYYFNNKNKRRSQHVR